MKTHVSGAGITLLLLLTPLVILGLPQPAEASTAYGTLNNFDCVNDTGVEAHGFEIELDDIHSTDITYTYDYNHYGIPRITEDSPNQAHPTVRIRWAATRRPDGTWTAYTAIPSGPITPTDGHQFTNPSINFGGEHFGVGYYGAPTAVRNYWLIDDGTGNLVHGPPVSIATPAFAYYPPALLQPAQVQAVIVPPPPPAPPVLQWWGEATWVKQIKTTTHNPRKVALNDLVDPDPDNPAAPDWANGEPAEVETEWRILQTNFRDAANPKGELAGAPEDLPDGDEVITRRYEFYKYIGPVDGESGEAMGEAVGALAADGIHRFGVGTVTYNHHIDPLTGEWVKQTDDLTTIWVVGEFFGAQMSGFDVAPALGLIDHIPDGELGVPYDGRTVVVAGGAAFLVAITSGTPPDGTTLDLVTGVFSGRPTRAGVFTFTVQASDTTGAFVSKTYTVTIPAAAVVTSTITTSSWPLAGGTTAGGGTFENGTSITVVATHADGYAFVSWTEGGAEVSASAVYPFTVTADRSLVANFVPAWAIATSASPAEGGSTVGDGLFNHNTSVTVTATPNVGYTFLDWTEGGVPVSSTAAYTFLATANRTLVARFVPIPTYTITTTAAPPGTGTVTGGGTFSQDASVTVVATPTAGYDFVSWTELGVVVSSSASYTFTATANRDLAASFAPNQPILAINGATATRKGTKGEVTLVIGNSGSTARSVTIVSRKDALLAGKTTSARVPVVLGDIVTGGAKTVTLPFPVKPGTALLQLTLTYTGGTAALSASVLIP